MPQFPFAFGFRISVRHATTSHASKWSARKYHGPRALEMWPHLDHKTSPFSCIFGGIERTKATESAGLVRFTENSIPTAPTNLVIESKGLPEQTPEALCCILVQSVRVCHLKRLINLPCFYRVVW